MLGSADPRISDLGSVVAAVPRRPVAISIDGLVRPLRPRVIGVPAPSGPYRTVRGRATHALATHALATQPLATQPLAGRAVAAAPGFGFVPRISSARGFDHPPGL